MIKALNKDSPFLTSVGLLALRLTFGGTMAIAHGLSKIQKWDEYKDQFMDFMGLGPTLSFALAIFAEFGCSILIVLGAFTRLACIPLLITMAVAFFMVHGDDPWQKKEMAFLYMGVFLTLFFTGAGSISVDKKMK